MKSAPLSAFLICVFLAAASLASEPNALRSKVLHDTVIQGYPCARGYAWFYPDGSLNECTVARPVTFGAVRVPRGSGPTAPPVTLTCPTLHSSPDTTS